MIKKLFIMFLLLLSGCYNYNELNDLAIVTSLGIDYENNMYQVSMQVVDTKEEPNYIIYEANGKTVDEAINNISLKCPKKIYLSHIETLIYGNEMAKHGLNDTIDFFLRENSIRGDFYLYVSKNKASNILNSKTPIYNINSEYIKKLNEDSYEKTGKSIIVNFYDFSDTYLNQNKDNILPTLILENGEIIIDDMALFKDDKLVGYLDNKYAIPLNILNNELKEATYYLPYSDGYINIIITNVNTMIDQNNINIEGEGKISSITAKNIDDIKKINDDLNNSVKEEIKSLIVISQILNIDYIGLKDIAYKNKKELKNDYIINVNINIISTGNIKEEIKNA